MKIAERTMVRAVHWRHPVWLEEAHSWIRAHVPGTLIGPIEQPHVYPWATVLRVPTSDGVAWFKANAPIQHFEAALALELAGAAPDVIAELVAVEVERGWLLMRHADSRLREFAAGVEQTDHCLAIGAAMALFRRRFVLLVEKGITLPSNLQGLYEVRYEGDGLDHDATMKLLKSFNEFRDKE